MKKPYRRISHTADLGMIVRGSSLPDLFANAAWAFFDIMIEEKRVEPKGKKEIMVQAPDRETLLISWLGEFLFLFETQGLVFSHFEIHLLTPEILRATARGERYDPKKHPYKTAIKAVTYHQLRIYKKNGIWRARVIFDL